MTAQTTSLVGAVAVVTDAHRGLGPLFVAELLRRGAQVHAMSPAPSPDARARVSVSRLDVMDPDSIAGAAARAPDATLIINNQMLSTGARLVDGDLRDIDLEMETNFYGALGVIRAFAPVLVAHGAGTIVNVHRAAETGAYAASVAAARAMTAVTRAELAAHSVRVAALHVALAADEARLAGPVAHAFDDLLDGSEDVVVDHQGTPGRDRAVRCGDSRNELHTLSR
jgi:NAD(P)-dependent dehydrogenase (short-subunit alcohol dehydrogenase family)